MLKARSLMKDDKALDLFTKMDSALLRNDVPRDKIDDRIMQFFARNNFLITTQGKAVVAAPRQQRLK